MDQEWGELYMNKIKKNNHLLPRMVIKRWEEHDGKIYDKGENISRPINKLDYSEKYYYSLGKEDDVLENRISKFEAYIGNLLKKINFSDTQIELTEKEMEILKLYVLLQSCRTHNTSPVILFDESDLYKNNNYLFGVPLVETQESAVKITAMICDEFDRIIQLSETAKYSYNYRFLAFGEINSHMLMGLHLVIAKNNFNGFLISETTAVIECTLDSDFLFSYTPVSPSISLLLVKSKYFFTPSEIEYTKVRFGRKYGNGNPDPHISEAIKDYKLCFNANITKEHKVIIKYINLTEYEMWFLNSIIYEDGTKILYSNQNELDKAKIKNNSRYIVLG